MNQSPENNTDNKDQENDEVYEVTLSLNKSIFLEVADNQDVPDAFQPIISQLFDRYLTIALATPNLFAIENHQARVFLKGVCETSIKWKLEEDINNLFQKKLDSIVEKINTSEAYDNKEFIKYQNELDKVLIKLRKRAEVKKKRLKEKLMGQEKIERAKESTLQAIQERMVNKKLPEFVKDILEGEWSNVLVLLHIRHGIASAEYQSKLDFVDLLIECLLLKRSNAKEKIKLLRNKYLEGLVLVGFNQQEILIKQQEIVKNITQHYQSNTRKSKPVEPRPLQKTSESKSKQVESVPEKIVEKIVPETKAEELSEVQEFEEHIETAEPDESIEIKELEERIEIEKADSPVDYNEIVASLKTGTWFEIFDKDNNITKAKLSWVSPISGNLLFVNSQGLKITDKTSSELAKELENQSFQIMKVIE